MSEKNAGSWMSALGLMLALLCVAFITLKLTGHIVWPWWLVLAPGGLLALPVVLALAVSGGGMLALAVHGLRGLLRLVGGLWRGRDITRGR